MIKKEIKHFKLKVGEYENVGASVPTSVLSALCEAGLICEPYFGSRPPYLSSILSGGAVYTAEFDVDPVMLGQDSLIMRLHGVEAPLVVSVNGVPLSGLECAHVPYDVDIKKRVSLGKNTLALRFAPRPASGEYLDDIGIFAPVELISYNRAIIDDVLVTQRREGDSVKIGVNMTTLGYNLKPGAVAVLASPGGAISYATLVEGKGEMTVAIPNLWRPGKFRTHSLYRLTVNLYSDGELIDSRELKIGLRSLELSAGRELLLSSSPYRPVAVRYCAADLIKPRATAERVRRMLERVADAGIDMIVAEPRDAYPSKNFLSSCDELGIALAIRLIEPKRDRTPIGERLARADMTASLKRLASHPSVLLITGGGAFADMARELVGELLPGALYTDALPASCELIPSLPTAYTSDTYFGKDDMNVASPALIDRGADGIDHLMRAVIGRSRMPHSFDEWTYLSGVLSAESAVRSVREIDLLPKPLGAAVLELGEPMPRLSASILDYSGRVKAAYYYLKRATSQKGAFAILDGKRVSFYAVNRGVSPYRSRLNYSVTRNDNRVIVRDSVEFSAAPECVSLIYEYDAGEIVAGREREYYLAYSVTDSAGTHSRDTVLFTELSRFEFKKPDIVIDVSGSGSEYTVSLLSDVYTKAVEVWFEGEHDVILEDNFIDITSPAAIRLSLKTSRPTAVETLKRELRVRSMYDVGRRS